MQTDQNLIVQTRNGAFIGLDPSTAMTRVQADGSKNCLSLASRLVPAAERNAAPNSLLPGPVLAFVPISEGSSTPKDMYRAFRLRKGQPLATAADDGGPIGARFEYLPDPPTLPQTR